jgi:hypothetical protein
VETLTLGGELLTGQVAGGQVAGGESVIWN